MQAHLVGSTASRLEKEQRSKVQAMNTSNGHGGARQGAGRPPGSRNKRSVALADELVSEGRCPVRALARLAERAEAEGDLASAIAAQRIVAQYVHPRPKPVEHDPDGAVELARALKAATTPENATETFVDMVERALRDIEHTRVF
jgi:hypothetical protein